MPPYDPQLHHRRSIRLPGYDYSHAGAYFITLVTHQRESLYGEISGGVLRLNRFGEIVSQAWLDLPRHYPHAVLDAFICMPNHVHGIVVLRDDTGRGGSVPGKLPTQSGTYSDKTHLPEDAQTRPYVDDTYAAREGSIPGVLITPSGAPSGETSLPEDDQTRPYVVARHGLPEIIRAFKSFSARRINIIRRTPGVPVWQRNYYEHIIRDEKEMDAIRRYIQDNPAQWELDPENPTPARSA